MAFTYTGEQVDLGFGRGWMNRPAAASIRRIDAQIGHALQITEAGRTWQQQDAHFQRYLRYGSPIAMNPDAPSLHQKGNAADSNEAQRIQAVMEDHGWRRTVYRYVNGVWTLVEPWHYEYFEHLDNHRYDPAPAGKEDDSMSAADVAELKTFIVQQFSNNLEYKGAGYTYPAVADDKLNALAAAVASIQAGNIRFAPDAGYLLGPALAGTIRESDGQPAQQVEVDEEAIAKALAPLLPQHISALSDVDVQRLAAAANDEQDRRARERLG